MEYLKLRLVAAMQSYGKAEDWYDHRRTENKPTKSSIVGMISRAMGIWAEETDKLQQVQDSIKSFEVIQSSKRARRMIDDQVVYVGDYVQDNRAKGLTSADGTIKKAGTGKLALSQKIYKEYLVDADFIVEIGGDKEFIDNAREALLHPIYPYYLGRACCIPAACVVL